MADRINHSTPPFYAMYYCTDVSIHWMSENPLATLKLLRFTAHKEYYLSIIPMFKQNQNYGWLSKLFGNKYGFLIL